MLILTDDMLDTISITTDDTLSARNGRMLASVYGWSSYAL